MPQCIQCGSETDNTLPLLSIKTLHIRDLKGERRMQALGSFCSGSVCMNCCKRNAEDTLEPKKRLGKSALLCGLLAAGGIAAFALVTDWVFRLPAICAVICGGTVFYSNLQKAKVAKEAAMKLAPEVLLRQSALELLQKRMPQKDGECNLTYMDMKDVLQAKDAKELALRYGILLPIARQAIERANAPEQEAVETASSEDITPQ